MTKAAIRYHTNRQYIYRWSKRYDGTYEQMQYPGQRVQIDVKFVPKNCLVGAAAEERMNTAVSAIWRRSGSTALIPPLNLSSIA